MKPIELIAGNDESLVYASVGGVKQEIRKNARIGRFHPASGPDVRAEETPLEWSRDGDAYVATARHESGVTIAIRYSVEGDAFIIRSTVSNDSEQTFDLITYRTHKEHFAEGSPEIDFGSVVGDCPRGTSWSLITHADGSKAVVQCVDPKGLVDLYSRSNGNVRYDMRVPYLRPGDSHEFVVSVRWPETDEEAQQALEQARENHLERWPNITNWPDRRPVGKTYPGDGDKSKGNPRGWRWMKGRDVASEWDAFAEGYLAHVEDCVQRTKAIHGQGLIIWSLEGEEFPHPITYLGAPADIHRLDLAPELTPELLEQIFRRVTDAGLHAGVTIRPQRLTRRAPGKHWFDQVQLPPEEAQAEIARQVEYCREKWGVTIFYVDTNNTTQGRLDARPIKEQFPDVLLIPEHSTHAEYLYGFPMAAEVGNPPDQVRELYPDTAMFCHQQRKKYTEPANRASLEWAVEDGNVPSFRAWFDDDDVQVVGEVYEEFGQVTPTPEPAPPPKPKPDPKPKPKPKPDPDTQSQIDRLNARMDSIEARLGSARITFDPEVE